MLPDDITVIDRASVRLLDSLANVHDAAFKQIGQQGWGAGQIGSSLNQAGGQLAYISADEAVAGFALYKTVLDEAELFTLAVDPAQQRTGLASRLLNAIGNRLKKDNVVSFFLEVRCDNIGAIACYQKLGFEQVATRKNYYTDSGGTKTDASIFRLSL